MSETAPSAVRTLLSVESASDERGFSLAARILSSGLRPVSAELVLLEEQAPNEEKAAEAVMMRKSFIRFGLSVRASFAILVPIRSRFT